MTGNIYKITDITNNKVYIGQTKRDIMRRYSDHISHAFVSKRPNDLSCELYIAMREHGIQNFIPELIETVEGTPKDIDDKEREWISKYDSTNPEKGYNKDKGGHIISEACRKAAEKHLFKTGDKLTGKMLEVARENGMKVAKAVYQIDKHTGNVIAEFPSIIEASRSTGCDRRAIQRQLKGEYGKLTPRSFSNLKYIWKYKEQ
ncbi:endonuclease [uncultured phage cr52_1]|uniref:Endonuclease n=1 Tax=uncultured phage cr52_1 TaxID=2772079 RepID=A0A7M1RQS7_9CAUD|nr:homing endonuclease with GIY-YIG motif [uncultured phage cr52_1]QOR56713.1 endonuclease [uncultured phage cr52_1]